jgi:hypothetical protein
LNGHSAANSAWDRALEPIGLNDRQRSVAETRVAMTSGFA